MVHEFFKFLEFVSGSFEIEFEVFADAVLFELSLHFGQVLKVLILFVAFVDSHSLLLAIIFSFNLKCVLRHFF